MPSKKTNGGHNRFKAFQSETTKKKSHSFLFVLVRIKLIIFSFTQLDIKVGSLLLLFSRDYKLIIFKLRRKKS